jgi:hypothetical protein
MSSDKNDRFLTKAFLFCVLRAEGARVSEREISFIGWKELIILKILTQETDLIKGIYVPKIFSNSNHNIYVE